ncbi:MAG: hypothetical protein ABS960_10040 [Solibacillus isronensis]
MAKIPLNQVVGGIKKTAQIIKENEETLKKAAIIIPLIPHVKDAANSAINVIKNQNEKRIEKKKNKGKIPFREIKYLEYNSRILPNLDSYSYIELKSYINEIRSLIEQIEREESEKKLKAKLAEKKLDDWRNILSIIEDKVSNRCYEEFLKIHYSNNNDSKFFEEKIIISFREIQNKEEMTEFIKRFTKNDVSEILMDIY